MATKKSARAKKPRVVAASAIIPKLKLDMPLDEKKKKAIQRCIEKGTLSITVNQVDLAAGRIGDAWLYD